MFHTLHDLTDASVAGLDGRIGRVRNVFFDDQSWKVRYFVVDLRGWLAHREVVISVSVADRPDWQKKVLRARITRKEARNSPPLDLMKPVARQQEIALRTYYGWTQEWEGFAGEFSIPSSPTGREYPVPTNEDPHLRSANHMAGYEMWNKKHLIGWLENFVLDDRSWRISYLEAKTGNWLYRRSFLVPTTLVESLSWANHRVNITRISDSSPASLS